MTIQTILTAPDDRLRQIAKEVADPRAPEIRTLVNDMAETMYDAPGVGLAAPQIGVLLRVVVTDTLWRKEENRRDLRIWINPRIEQREGHIRYEEGCLSLPGIYEEVDRAATVRLSWCTLDGVRHEQLFHDFQAVALQHEFDHLEGRLFIDHLSLLKRKMIAKKLKKNAH